MARNLTSWMRMMLMSFSLVVSALPASAKVIAIVFDTSGSMQDRYHLPSFGARLLAATIDGRAGFDRLLVMNFNDYYVAFPALRGQGLDPPTPVTVPRVSQMLPGAIESYEITNPGQHKQIVNDLSASFRFTDAGTPYGPVEVMLDRIAQEVESQQGEEVVLIVISDGLYNPDEDFVGGRLVPQLRANFETYRQRITQAGGSLRAEYLFIDGTRGAVDPNGNTLREIIQIQGVRDTLLEVFNGPVRDANGDLEGARYVDDGGALWEALQDIIAKVAGTDRQAQRNLIERQGQTMTVTSPLSISRMVVVSTAPLGQTPPTRQSDNFTETPSDTRRLRVDANGKDPEFSAPALTSTVEHLYFQRALPSGSYQLQFDRPVTPNNVFLLFETSSKIDLKIFDANGAEVQPGQDGVLTLFKGSAYRFASQILDGDVSPAPVDFATLPPSLSMSLSLSAPVGPGTQSMQPDDTLDEGTLTWTPETVGELIAFSRASAGILSPQSDRLQIRVLDPVTTLTLGPVVSIVDCPSCDVGQVSSPVDGTEEDLQVGSFPVTADGDRDGAIAFGDLPEGYEIRDQNGTPIQPGQVIPFGSEETQKFSLWRRGGVDPNALAQGFDDVGITVRQAGPWEGEGVTSDVTVLLDPSDMSIRLQNVTEFITPGDVDDGLLVPGGELTVGQFSAQLSLVDILQPPDPDNLEDAVTITSNRWIDGAVGFETIVPDFRQVGFHALEVRPKTHFLCLCWIWATNEVVGTDRREIKVDYKVILAGRTLQQAETSFPMAFQISRGRGSYSCMWNIILLFFAYVMFRWLIAMLTTHRFPRYAHLEITEADERVRKVPLGKGNKVWLRGLLAWARGNPDEVRDKEGLRLRATNNGAILDVSRNTPNWEMDSAGAPFSELKEMHSGKTEYKVNWDERFESINPPGRTLHLRKGRSGR